MTSVSAELISQQDGDASGFIEIVKSLALGLIREQKPARVYLVRIDGWFGPKWLNFSGKFSVASGVGFGVHKTRLRVPPFVPARVKSEQIFAAPEFAGAPLAEALHIDCSSKIALSRRIEDIDKNAIFVWFSSVSELQQRVAVMAYLPIIGNETGFYAGFAKSDGTWRPSMLRHISRGELDGLIGSRVQATALP
ncbi:MAG TPA: hypothetical protein VG714_02125 [Acidobacteriaceae bacterium]|nr:hypothetical protein [Acidobacteriaceae bacterium]